VIGPASGETGGGYSIGTGRTRRDVRESFRNGVDTDLSADQLWQAFASHARDWRSNLYVYPVVSRRAGGVSIGINLNPDKACNFDCVYCQVDRTIPPKVRRVEIETLRRELDEMLALVVGGRLFDDPPFASLPPEFRRARDIAFSGDGEPTASPVFADAVRIAAERKTAHGLADLKMVLITDACYLTQPAVRAGLEVMDAHNGEIWAKLDAGTEAYFRRVNRPSVPLRHVLNNILETARVRPIVIQSLWMRLGGCSPPDEEVDAFADRLHEIVTGGGRIKLVQVYTVARRTAEADVTALSNEELDRVARRVRQRSGLIVKTYYGPGDGGAR